MRVQAGRRIPLSRLLLTVTMGLLVFVFGLFASSQAMHKSLHHDGPSPTSHCVVCFFAKGQLDAATVQSFACAPVLLFVSNPLTIAGHPPEFQPALLPPGRAPPVPSAVS